MQQIEVAFMVLRLRLELRTPQSGLLNTMPGSGEISTWTSCRLITPPPLRVSQSLALSWCLQFTCDELGAAAAGPGNRVWEPLVNTKAQPSRTWQWHPGDQMNMIAQVRRSQLSYHTVAWITAEGSAWLLRAGSLDWREALPPPTQALVYSWLPPLSYHLEDMEFNKVVFKLFYQL